MEQNNQRGLVFSHVCQTKHRIDESGDKRHARKINSVDGFATFLNDC